MDNSAADQAGWTGSILDTLLLCIIHSFHQILCKKVQKHVFLKSKKLSWNISSFWTPFNQAFYVRE